MKKLLSVAICFWVLVSYGQEIPRGYDGVVWKSKEPTRMYVNSEDNNIYYAMKAYDAVKLIIKDSLGKDVQVPKDDSIEIVTYNKALTNKIKMGTDTIYSNRYFSSSTEHKGVKKIWNTVWPWQYIIETDLTYVIKSYCYTPNGNVYYQMEVKWQNTPEIGKSMSYHNKEFWEVIHFYTSKKDFKIHRF